MTEKIKGGYILLARNMIESEIWQKPPAYLKIWIYILFRVNWKKSKHNEIGMDLFNFTQEKIPGVKQTQVYDFLRWAKTLNSSDQTTQITTQKTTRGIRLKVNKYEYYQDPRNYQFQNTFQDTFQHNSKTIPKTLINSINTSYINTHTIEKNVCVKNSNIEISKEDKKILRMYAKNNGAKNIGAYVHQLIINGGYIEILETEKEKQEKRRAEQARFLVEKEKQEQEPELTQEERQAALERARELAGINKKRRTKNG